MWNGQELKEAVRRDLVSAAAVAPERFFVGSVSGISEAGKIGECGCGGEGEGGEGER